MSSQLHLHHPHKSKPGKQPTNPSLPYTLTAPNSPCLPSTILLTYLLFQTMPNSTLPPSVHTLTLVVPFGT